MPIEIRELVIRTTVTDDAPPPAQRQADLGEAKKEIIEACLEEVWEKLERRTKR